MMGCMSIHREQFNISSAMLLLLPLELVGVLIPQGTPRAHGGVKCHVSVKKEIKNDKTIFF